MKGNAIARIILYSLLILILFGILAVSLGVDLFMIRTDSETTTGEISGTEASVEAKDVSKLNIEWAAGSITIVTADTDQITFCESGDFAEKYAMVYSQKDDTLTIAYAKGSATVGFGSIPSKDLTVTVPQDWVCQELEIDGAALEVEIDGMTVTKFDIDGASNEIIFTGSVDTIECDGAACDLNITCTNKPKSIDLDGASIQLGLTLPADCGFLVQMDGLSCSFRTEAQYKKGNGTYMYGDQHCHVNADGLSCSITINHAPVAVEFE